MKTLLTLALLIHAALAAQAKDFSYAEAVTFLGTEDVAKQLKKAVFAVQVEGNLQDADPANDWVPIGSGFFVSGKNNAVLGVSCNHVVATPLAEKKAIYAGLETDDGYKRGLCRILYQDPVNDIAILSVQRRSNDNFRFENLTFTESIFDDSSSLVEGRGVIIPGYPLSLGIEDDRNNPVIRLGVIAQFTGKDYFLIDGVASLGNSGSPVFALNYKNHKLVGMITAFVNDKIRLFDQNGNVIALLPYNSGLARAVTMKMIVEALQKAAGKY